MVSIAAPPPGTEDTVASMLVSRFLYGKDWYKRDLKKELAEAEQKKE